MLRFGKGFTNILTKSSLLRVLSPSSTFANSLIRPVSLSQYTPFARFASFSDNIDDLEFINLSFVTKDNKNIPVKARIGDNILDIAKINNIDIEGACQACMACSTCHIILEPNVYEILPLPKPNEEDLLDHTIHLTGTSRLGCQVYVTKEFDGSKIRLPHHVHNQQRGDEF